MIVYQVNWCDERPLYFFKREVALEEIKKILLECIDTFEGNVRKRIEKMLSSGDIDGARREASISIETIEVV